MQVAEPGVNRNAPPSLGDLQTASSADHPTLWLITGDADDVAAVVSRLKSDGGRRYFQTFVSARSGRRILSDRDILLFGSENSRGVFEAFSSGGFDKEQWQIDLLEDVRSATSSPFESIVSAAIDLVFLQLAPAGRRKQRAASGRSALERAFESLKCEAIFRNEYLKERLSRQLLSAPGSSGDPLIQGILSRLRADALLRIAASSETSDVDRNRQAGNLYRTAEQCFLQANLPNRALDCARRKRLADRLTDSSDQLWLPGFTLPASPLEAVNDLGFSTRPCFALPVKLSQISLPRSDSADSNRFTYLGRFPAKPERLRPLFAGLSDQRESLRVEFAEGARPSTAQLHVSLRSTFAVLFGHDEEFPMLDGTSVFVSSPTCSFERLHLEVDSSGRAVFNFQVTGRGQHRIDVAFFRAGDQTPSLSSVAFWLPRRKFIDGSSYVQHGRSDPLSDFVEQ